MASTIVSATTCRAAYAVALISITAVAPTLASATSLGPLSTGLALDAIATAIVYAFSFASNNSSVYDPFWCILPLWLGFFFKSLAPGGVWFYEPRETLVLVLLWAWAVRFFVAIPWDGWTVGLEREDWRYADFRAKLPSPAYWAFSFSSLHLTPTLLVWAALAPASRVLLQGTAAPPLNTLDAAAALLAGGGILLEAVADAQLSRFRRDRGGRDSCAVGLWRWSRHPNYCGECTFWSGLLGFGFSSGAAQAEPLLAVGAPLMWLFFRAASVPLMDGRSQKRRRGYDVIMRAVSPLLLWPPRGELARSMPTLVQGHAD